MSHRGGNIIQKLRIRCATGGIVEVPVRMYTDTYGIATFSVCLQAPINLIISKNDFNELTAEVTKAIKATTSKPW